MSPYWWMRKNGSLGYFRKSPRLGSGWRFWQIKQSILIWILYHFWGENIPVGENYKILNVEKQNSANYSISFITIQLIFSGIPFFATANMNVYRGVVESNISVRVLVYSYSKISIQLYETKNGSLFTKKISDSIATVESCHEMMTIIKCYKITTYHLVTTSGVKLMSLEVNNSAGLNTFQFYVDAKGSIYKLIGKNCTALKSMYKDNWLSWIDHLVDHFVYIACTIPIFEKRSFLFA